jgi:hypothetical protein
MTLAIAAVPASVPSGPSVVRLGMALLLLLLLL